MKKIKFEYYNKDEFDSFVSQLNKKDATKLLSIIKKIEKYGLPIAAKKGWTKKSESNLYEIRSKWASNIQRALYFKVINGNYIITNVFTKKQQKTPKKEKELAKSRRKEFFERNKDE